MKKNKPDRTDWVTGQLADYDYEMPFGEFTEFEKQALTHLAQTFVGNEEVFLSQIKYAKVVDRINTIAGFYTHVVVDKSKCEELAIDYKVAHFDVEGLEYGIGMVLWDDNGYLETIEGFVYEDNALKDKKLTDLKYISFLQSG